MAKEKTPFHQLLISTGLSEEALKAVLVAHEAELKKLYEAKTAEIKKLTADHAAELKIADDAKTAELEKLKADHSAAMNQASDSIAALEQKVAEFSAKIEKTERFTPGVYKAKNKKTFKFQDGILEFVFARNGVPHTYETKEAIKDAALMEELISIEAGYIQEVEVES